MTTKTMKNMEPEQPTILLVDGGVVSSSIKVVLESNQFQVTTAVNVNEALHLIDSEHFDALLCALHIAEAGDGFTVANAMQNTNPDAITLVYTGYPELNHAMDAALLPADEVSVKFTAIPALVSRLHDRLKPRMTRKPRSGECAVALLERGTLAIITDWLSRVEREAGLKCVPLSKEQRVAHLPKLLQELVHHLRIPQEIGAKVLSKVAVEHGRLRRSQGYSIAMIVEEFCLFRASIFEHLQNKLNGKDASLPLKDVVTIAEECDSQLMQILISFMEESIGIAA